MAQSTCSVDGCDGVAVSRGWCKKHYTRWLRHGEMSDERHDPRLSWPDNFLSRLTPMGEGCLTLVGIDPDRDGYLHVWAEGRRASAHRAAYEHFVGPIPEGMTLDHECHNRDESCAGGPTCLHRRCVNWEHLTPKPIGENTNASPNSWSARTHCPKGHPYDEANTYIRPSGGRKCRACAAEAERERRQRRIISRCP